MGMFDRNTTTTQITPAEPVRTEVKKYTIAVDAIVKLCQMRERAESVGFEPVVSLDNGEFAVTFIHELVEVPCRGFETGEHLEVPNGDALANAVRMFTKAYVPSKEIKKRQEAILSSNDILTVAKVQEIENTVTTIVNACTMLASALDHGREVIRGSVPLEPIVDEEEDDSPEFRETTDFTKKPETKRPATVKQMPNGK